MPYNKACLLSRHIPTSVLEYMTQDYEELNPTGKNFDQWKTGNEKKLSRQITFLSPLDGTVQGTISLSTFATDFSWWHGFVCQELLRKQKPTHIGVHTSHCFISFTFSFFFPGISSSDKWLVLNLCHRVCFLGNQSGSRKQTLRTWFGNEVLICVKEIRTCLLVTVVWCGSNFWSGATWQSPQTVMLLIGKTYS